MAVATNRLESTRTRMEAPISETLKSQQPSGRVERGQRKRHHDHRNEGRRKISINPQRTDEPGCTLE